MMPTLERTGTGTRAVSATREDKRVYSVSLHLEEKCLFAIIVLTCLLQSWSPAFASLTFLSWANLRWALCILLVAHGFVWFYVFRQSAIPNIGSALGWCMVFLVVCLSSGLGDRWPAILKWVLRGDRFSSLTLFLAVIIYVNRPAQRRLIVAVVWIGFLFSLLSFVEFHQPERFVLFREQLGIVPYEKQFEYLAENRTALMWANAPAFGTFLALVVPLCLYRIRVARTIRAALLGYVQLACLAMGLLTTGSRGPIAAAVFSATLFILWDRGRRRWVILATSALVLLLGWRIVAEPLIAPTGAWTRLLNYSIQYEQRLLLWKTAWDQYLSANWLWGIGYGEWWRLYGWDSPVGGFFVESVRSLHSFYVQVWVETGLKGLLVEVVFLALLFWKTWRLPKVSSPIQKDTVLLKRTFFLSVLVMAICSVFDLPLGTAPFMHLYFAFAGVLWRGEE